jgi:hypothetical protein
MKTLLTICILAISAFALDVSVPKTRYRSNVDFTVPVSVTQTDGLIAYQLELNYDPHVLTAQDCTVEGTFAEDMTVLCNIQQGVVSVSAFGVEPLEWGSGPVLYINFHCGQGKSELSFSNGYFFELTGILPAKFINGSVALGRQVEP